MLPSSSGSRLQLPNESEVKLVNQSSTSINTPHKSVPGFELGQEEHTNYNYDNVFSTTTLDTHTDSYRFSPTQQPYLSAGAPLLVDKNTSREQLIGTSNMSYPPQRPDLGHQGDSSYTHVPTPGGISGLPYDPERQQSQGSTSSSAKLRKPGWGKKDAEQGYKELDDSRSGYSPNQSDTMLRLPDGEIPKTKVGFSFNSMREKRGCSFVRGVGRLESCMVG